MTHRKAVHAVAQGDAVRTFQVSGLTNVDEHDRCAIVHAILLENDSSDMGDDGEYYPEFEFNLDEYSYATIPYSDNGYQKPVTIYVGDRVMCHSKDYWEHWHHECDSLILVTRMTPKFKEKAVKKYPFSTLCNNSGCIFADSLVAVRRSEHDALKSLGLSFIEVCLINGGRE